MPKLAAALAFLASLLLIASLLFTALQLVMHDETWFAARYEAYGTAGEIGIPTKDITAALMQLIDYMEGDVASIDLTVMENGIPVNDNTMVEVLDLCNYLGMDFGAYFGDYRPPVKKDVFKGNY